MTPEQFAYWLNGFVELTEWRQPTPEQWKSICEHLGTVFNKVTPALQVTGPAFADPARQMTPLEMLERGKLAGLTITC
jgi:hypothetical protein